MKKKSFFLVAIVSVILLMFISIKDNNLTFKAVQASAYVSQQTDLCTTSSPNTGKCSGSGSKYECTCSDKNQDCNGIISF